MRQSRVQMLHLLQFLIRWGRKYRFQKSIVMFPHCRNLIRLLCQMEFTSYQQVIAKGWQLEKLLCVNKWRIKPQYMTSTAMRMSSLGRSPRIVSQFWIFLIASSLLSTLPNNHCSRDQCLPYLHNVQHSKPHVCGMVVGYKFAGMVQSGSLAPSALPVKASLLSEDTSLSQEVLDWVMEKCAIEISIKCQFYEIITVKRCLYIYGRWFLPLWYVFLFCLPYMYLR